MSSPLDNAAIDLQALRQLARTELSSILDGIGTDIALVLDPALVGPLGQIAEVSLLKAHGVSNIYTLADEDLHTESSSVLYLIRPDVSLIPFISRQVQEHHNQPSSSGKFHSIVVVPRKTILIERALAEHGIYGDVELGEFHMDLIPQDEDLLNMELGGSFRSLFVEGDISSLYYVANSLLKLEKLYGRIPEIYGKGNYSEQILNLMKRIRRENEMEGSTPKPNLFSSSALASSEIDSLVLLDRTADMITPFLSQQTYEGLLDEVIGIHNGFVDVDKEVLGMKDKQGRALKGNKKLVLNSGDTLYKEVRDLTFSALGNFLKKKAAFISKVYEERHEAETISQISDFMKKFKTLNKEHSSLQHHINLAEHLATERTKTVDFIQRCRTELGIIGFDGVSAAEEYLEGIIGKMAPLEDVLGLWCLMNVIPNGSKQKRIDFFKREIIQTYGFQYFCTLQNLERLGLVKAVQGRHFWATLRKGFGLFKDLDKSPPISTESSSSFGPNTVPFDLHTLYEGYAPLSTRIVEHATTSLWNSIQEPLRLLPGVQFVQFPPRKVTDTSIPTPSSSKRQKLTLVFYVGGVTYSEISALRQLSRDPLHDREYIVATTHIINRKSLVGEMTTVLPNKMDSVF